MSRERRALAALAVITLVALISACGSSAPAGTGTRSANNTATGAKNAKGVKFAECMRSSGVGDFPDPNANGEFVYGVSVTPAVFDKAVAACKALEPPGSLSAQRSPKQQSLSLKFAKCVRNNGVKDFPDPVDGQPLIDTTKIPSSDSPGGMSILNAATHTCGGLLQLAAGGGTGG